MSRDRDRRLGSARFDSLITLNDHSHTISRKYSDLICMILMLAFTKYKYYYTTVSTTRVYILYYTVRHINDNPVCMQEFALIQSTFDIYINILYSLGFL